MKKRLSLIVALMLMFFSFLGFNSLNVHAEVSRTELTEELENIVVPEQAIIDFPVVSVSAYGSVITWESSNSSVLNVPTNGGWVKVTRPTNEDVTVTLTVKLVNGSEELSKAFEVLVPKGQTITNQYAITYELNGGTQNSQNPTSYLVGEEKTFVDPTKGVLEFLGWYDNPEFSGEAINTLPKGLSGDYKLYAKWATPVVTGIKVVTMPSKTTYNALETFVSSGIKVQKVYNYGDPVELLESELSFDKEVLHASDTKVIVSYQGFTADISVTVNKLNYDLSKLEFKDTSLVYNGKDQTISVDQNLGGLGDLGLTATVEGTGKNVSETPYLVTLKFSTTNNDYNTPSDLTANLTITKAPLKVTTKSTSSKVGEDLPKFSVVYDGFVNGENESVLDLTNLSFTTNASSTSPAGAYDVTPQGIVSTNYEISYVKGTLTITSGTYSIVASNLELVYNGQKQMFSAKLMDGENQINVNFTFKFQNQTFDGAVNVGTYEVEVSYNDATYGSGSQSFTFQIKKAKYDMSKVVFEDASVVYNGEKQNLVISGTLPSGVSVSYSEGLVNVGSKVITASFTGDASNYEVITSMTATLTVTEKVLEASMFDNIPSQSYTGNALTPTVSGKFNNKALELGTDFSVQYEDNTEKGVATVKVTGLGNFKDTISLTFVIGNSDLEKVTEVKDSLKNEYQNILTGKVTSLVASLRITDTNEYHTDIYWSSSSTAISVDPKTGKVTTLLTSVDQKVTLYVLITLNDAAEYASFTFTLPKKASILDQTTSVKVVGVMEGLTLNVKTLTTQETGSITVQDGKQVVSGYDITLQDGSTVVQPNGKVTVYLPVPTSVTNEETLVVYYVGDNNTLENMNAKVVTIDGVKYLEFEITHFSKYVIVGDEETTIEKGTLENPYTAEEALAIIKQYESGKTSDDEYYVKGTVSAMNISLSYGNATFYFGDLQAYRLYYLEKAKFTNAYELLDGDVVIVKAKFANYNGTCELKDGYIYEFVSKVERTKYNVDVTVSGGNGEASVDNSEVEANTKVTLTFTPDNDYQAKTIKINDNNEIVVRGKTTYDIVVTENLTIVVTFEKISDAPVVTDIEFKSSSADGTAELSKTTIIDQIESGAELIDSVTSLSKAYPGINGIKFGTGSVKGSITIVLTKSVSSLVIEFSAYSTDNTVVLVNGIEATSGEKIELDESTNTITIEAKNASKNRFYLSKISFGEVKEKTDEEKVNDALATLTDTTVETDFALNSSSNGVTLTYQIKSGDAITINDTTATVTRPEYEAGDATVVITVTATLNEITKTKDVTYTVSKKAQVVVSNADAIFTFGENGAAAHADGTTLTAKEEESNGYTLKLENLVKVSGNAYDAKGNSCLKLGTTSIAGSFSFTVSDDINEVKIYVAQYKANITKVKINDTDYTIESASNNGEYDIITIDTSTNKTVTFTTVSGGLRCMINTIEFYKQAQNN